MPRFWSLEAARAALPEVVRRIEEVQALLQQAAAQPQAAAQLPAGAVSAPRSVNGHGAARPHDPMQRAQRLLRDLAALGVQIKDVQIGLLDFPYLRGDEEVLLCYRMGESDILFWHTLEAGFAGRRPIGEL